MDDGLLGGLFKAIETIDEIDRLIYEAAKKSDIYNDFYNFIELIEVQNG